MELITTRYQNQVAGMLNCFDRIVLTGTLRQFCYSSGMEGYLREKETRCFDFQDKLAKPLADCLKKHTQKLADAAGIEIDYLGKSGIRKESFVAAKLAKHGDKPGLVCIISCVEGCMRFLPQYFREKNYTGLLLKPGQCLHYYFYFIDELLGLCYLRVPTWLPCRLQFYSNGHNILANRLRQENIDFTMNDNCFTAIDSFEKANRLAADIDVAELERRLKHYVDSFIPAVEQVLPDKYNWSIMQLELSSDITFKDDAILSEIYEQLVSSAVHTVKVPDTVTFLGHQMPRTNLENYGSSLKKTVEGVRLKHNAGKHSIKMYDKFNRVLRIETTTNQVNLFRARRSVQHRDGSQTMEIAAVPKSIYSLPLLFELLNAANQRYHKFISAIEDFSVGRKNLEKVTAPVIENSRNYQGINFFNEADDKLLLAIFSGAFTVTGFRNQDLKQKLNQSTAKISRTLKRLHAHGLIKKIRGSYKYYLTNLGSEVIATGIKLKELYVIPRLNFIHS